VGLPGVHPRDLVVRKAVAMYMPSDPFRIRHTEIFLMRACGRTYAEIGRQFGISRTRARQIDRLAECRIANYAKILKAQCAR
jgi:hypothetical protein